MPRLQVVPTPKVYRDMAALELDAGLFTSEFRLCDTIAEYFASLLSQSFNDPARYANFSSLVINEMIETAFRSAGSTGKIEFSLLRDDTHIRVCVGFTQSQDVPLGQETPERSGQYVGQKPADNLPAFARAVGVSFSAEAHADHRMTLLADFPLMEGGH